MVVNFEVVSNHVHKSKSYFCYCHMITRHSFMYCRSFRGELIFVKRIRTVFLHVRNVTLTGHYRLIPVVVVRVTCIRRDKNYWVFLKLETLKYFFWWFAAISCKVLVNKTNIYGFLGT